MNEQHSKKLDHLIETVGQQTGAVSPSLRRAIIAHNVAWVNLKTDKANLPSCGDQGDVTLDLTIEDSVALRLAHHSRSLALIDGLQL